ncbi:MAG: DUF4321 domain-containing protein [Anaerovibrio sp.]|uniref:DUF4321 domain-containing protein n=1 Tax=Anaerovibrio slackiae TaxID=2652309 RepID=A0A6I2U9H2_9FIRM|nr:MULTISPECIES: DUF4321 domain-containing protein [Anaerovibrio]MBQ2009893.1 DUF4321 domain-containing protein [Selenomonadaceae bacterium]MBQ2411741.1 DUF4321 domain-containing protein [Selenomonadaceae bacterium]MBQ5586337.1 DUF4321 domain-containing protein [Selenomonadaceae bacterium]MBQ5650294.1 DUF4321 domain-containing protein [Selenomonadaceae bacterium]MBQ5732290.1 DUF4321 domain-containing protein [Selenomonadaceae bacterium]
MSVLSKSYGTLVLYVVIGAILGGLLGELLSGVDALSSLMPYLKNPYPVINVVPSVIDIYVISLTVGFSFSPNLMSIIGVVIAVWIFRHT